MKFKKIKKIFPVISLVAIVGAASSNFVSVNIGDQNGYAFLNGLKDFDWNDIYYGDGLDYKNNNRNAEAQKNILAAIKYGSAKKINSAVTGRFVDYHKFNTGYQYTESINKQAVTGVPLNAGFMPNGNAVSDFGVTSKAQKYTTVNSILDWDPNVDKDTRYDGSYTPLRKSTETAFSYKDDKSNEAYKNPDMKFNYLGFSSRKHRTFDNTSVGTKNPFEGTNLNWQYTSGYVNWSGSWFEGPIVPPPGDMIDMAHNNGTPIYGNIFLDGWHGLTKEMLKDFVKKDKDGNYPSVDFLLNLANDLGFEGYFLNDESNGSNPNGTVLDYNVLVDIVKQFNQKAAERHLDKKIIFYKNGATLEKRADGYFDRETYAMADTMPNDKPSDIQLDFWATPDKWKEFLENHKNYKANNLYSMADASGYLYTYGTYDWRQIAYAYDKKHSKYDTSQYNSISGYMDAGGAAFGNAALDLLNDKNESDKKKERDFIFANEVSNLYNNVFFNGINTNPSLKDAGYDLNNGAGNDYKDWDAQNTQQRFIADDPRIDIDNKAELKAKYKTGDPADGDVASKVYDYNANGGKNSHSYGVGNLIHEKTVFEDADNDKTSIKTNFSTGSGIKFVDRDTDSDNDPVEVNDYPYTNRRIADILPTYQWDINEVPSGAVDQLDPLDTNKPKITDLNGFYDYDDVYLKSNSIALGSKFNQQGQIEDGTWNTGENYIWNIMGTNLSKKHTFSLTYRDSQTKDGKEIGINEQADIKPVLTFTKNGVNKYVVLKNQDTDSSSNGGHFKEVSQTSDGWKTIQFNLDGTGIDKENKLSKVGLLITPTSNHNQFKLNVGQFAMDSNDETDNSEGLTNRLSNLASEYRIERGNLINMRLIYDPKPDFDYIEFYIKNKKGIWFRVGETSASEYFIKDIDKDEFGETVNLAAITYKNNHIIGSDKYEIN